MILGIMHETENFENLVKAGVVDPTKVTRIAVENAASIAAMLLTTECVISDQPERGSSGSGNASDGWRYARNDVSLSLYLHLF